MTCIHNTKIYDNLKCECKKKEICEKHPTNNCELVKKYQNYSSPFRTPINIRTDSNDVICSHEKMISFHYKCDIPGHYFNDGTKIEFEVEKGYDHAYINVTDDITCSKEKYILKQFHFHVTSENTVDNTFYPMEVHLVHENFDEKTGISKIVAIGLLLKIDKRSSPYLKGAFDECIFDKCITVDLTSLNCLPDNVHYTFLGSLTSPPFNVYFKWFVFTAKDVTTTNLTISDNTYRKHLEFYQNNRYPVNLEHDVNRYAKPLKNNFLAVTKVKTCSE